MAPAYKLTYLSITSLGETIRFLFSYAGIEFEDNRISRADWPKHKSEMPFGQVPILEHNGKVVNQSFAICKYIAKKVELVGNDDWEDLEIDAVAFTVNDIRLDFVQYFYEKDENQKEKLRKLIFNEKLPYYLSRFEKIAKENNGHLAVGRLTWADFYFATQIDRINVENDTDLIANYPYLTKVKENVYNLPAIKEWLKKCPKADL